MKWLALVVVCITGGFLLYGVSDFPEWKALNSPASGGVEGADKSVSQTFIKETYRLTEVPNMVTAVLADYRGYDTMFETVVVFAAGMAIFAILRVLRGSVDKVEYGHNEWSDGDHHRIIVGTTCKLLIPVIQIFALYVVAHGHYSPGGGFQGGVILGASFILLALADNLETAMKRFTERHYLVIGVTGILIYAGFGLVAQFLGSNFLEYGVLHQVMPGFLAENPVKARYQAILGVEIGVAFTVTAIMFAIYANLASKGDLKNGL